ncbi:MAG: FAD:protein FMN transferase [Pseudomonadota bacterium]|jgi:thiamine biosynthesis lipoprotein
MGTIVDMVAYGKEETAAGAAAQAFTRMTEIESLAHYSDKDGAVNRIRNGEGAEVKGDLSNILSTAMEVSRATSGAFDPTLGALVYLWGFGREEPTLPEPARIEEAFGGSGWERVPAKDCCPEGLKIWFDLGGVAKGYAVDDAVKVLETSGIRAGIVNAGGDLRTFGEKPGSGSWKIGIQDPENPRELAGILQLGDAAVATSGDYQRYFEKDGIRYHHILDPSTGYPAHSGLRGTTVIAPDCATADALATAAFVLGPERGLALLERWPDTEGVLITEDGEILTTSGIGEGGIGFEER